MVGDEAVFQGEGGQERTAGGTEAGAGGPVPGGRRVATSQVPPPVPASQAEMVEGGDLRQVGARIGAYRLIEVIGAGGMGIVYRARRGEEGPADLAIKMIRTGDLAGDVEIKRFRSEIANLARLRHPNICRFRDYGFENGIEYLVMDLIPGAKMETWMQDHQPAPRELARVLAKVCLAVEYAHQQGVLHRDINPRNIMVREDGEPVVMDFGLSRDLEQDQGLTITGIAVGTPPFMAPEQILGRRGQITPATDIWALGATLYYCLTEIPPFGGSDVQAVYQAIANEDPVWPHRLRPGVESVLERITMRCLQKRIEDRYPNPAALAADLQSFAGGGEVQVRLPGLARRIVRRSLRRPLMSVLVFGLALVLVFLAALAWRLHRQATSTWMVVVDQDFLSPSIANDRLGWLPGDLSQAVPSPPYASQGGLGFGSREEPWLWLEDPGLKGETSLVAHFDLPVVDAIDIALAAKREPLEQSWHFPRGWAVKVVGVASMTNTWTVRVDHQRHPGAMERSFERTMVRQGSPERLELTVRSTVDGLALAIDGQWVIRSDDPLGRVLPRGSGVGLRWYRAETRLTRLEIARAVVPIRADPLQVVRELLDAGLRERAEETTRQLAADRAGSAVGERALALAITLAATGPDYGANSVPEMWADFQRRHPHSAHWQEVAEAVAHSDWNSGRVDRALDLTEALTAADAESLALMRLVAHMRSHLSPAQADRALRQLTRNPLIEKVDFSGSSLASLEGVRGAPWRALNVNVNNVSDLAPTVDLPHLKTLQADFNRISDLSPLAGRRWHSLSLAGNQITDAGPLARSDIVANLDLSHNPLVRAPAFHATGPAKLSLAHTAIVDPAAAVHPGMRDLDLAGTEVSSVQALAGAVSLQALDLSQTPVGDLRPLAGLPLQALKLADCPAADLAPLASLPLRELDLSGRAPLDLTSLPLDGLTSLGLDRCRLERLPPALSQAGRLKRLTLAGNRFEAFPEIGQVPLEHLDLADNPLALLPLASTQNLAVLNVRGCALKTIHGSLASGTRLWLDAEACLLTSTQWQELATRWTREGDVAEARAALAMAYVLSGRQHLLPSLAFPVAGRKYTYVPAATEVDAARALARSLGGRLACIPDVPTNRALARALVFGSAYIGFHLEDGRYAWEDGGASSYRNDRLLWGPEQVALGTDATAYILTASGRWYPATDAGAGMLIEWP